MDQTSNFDFLNRHLDWLFKLAESAERNFSPNPNTTLINMCQLGDDIAQAIAARIGIEAGSNIKQIDLLRVIEYKLRLDDNVRDALKSLMVGYSLSMWFQVTFRGELVEY